MPLRFRWVWALNESANKKVAILAALYFGVFQRCDAGGAAQALPWRKRIAWLGSPRLQSNHSLVGEFRLLIGVGTKMIRESFVLYRCGETARFSFITHRVMLTLEVATRVDAMAAGSRYRWLCFTLNPWISPVS